LILFCIPKFDIRIYLVVSFKEMFRPVGSLIGNLHLRSKSQGAILALQIKRIAQEQIAKTVQDLPKVAIAQIKVKSFRNGQLTILAPTLVSLELKIRSEGLKDQINKALAKDIIKKIVFRTS